MVAAMVENKGIHNIPEGEQTERTGLANAMSVREWLEVLGNNRGIDLQLPPDMLPFIVTKVRPDQRNRADHDTLDIEFKENKAALEILGEVCNPFQGPGFRIKSRGIVFMGSFWVTMEGRLCFWNRDVILTFEDNLPGSQEEQASIRRELIARNRRLNLEPAPGAALVCPECDRLFAPVRSDQIYDCKHCATVASNRRKRLERKHLDLRLLKENDGS